MTAASEAPPEPDEIEVAVLGRGQGESCLVHLGRDRWLIVDSFYEPVRTELPVGDERRPAHSKVPAPAHYLDRLYAGSDRTPTVDAIVLTHLHRDHYLGIGELHTRFPQAYLAVPAALGADTLVAMFTARGAPDLQRIGEALQDAVRTRIGELGDCGLVPVFGGLTLTDVASDFRIHALAPSPANMAAAAENIAAVISAGTTPQEVRNRLRDENRTSIALLVTACDSTVLLGGDVVNARAHGWPIVMRLRNNQGLDPAGLVKAPHHGSVNAHYEPMWRTWVEPDSPVLVAPFWNKHVPRKEDQHRLASRRPLHQTGPSARRFDHAWMPVAKQRPRTGLIQARRRAGEQWRIAHAGPARQVNVAHVDGEG